MEGRRQGREGSGETEGEERSWLNGRNLSGFKDLCRIGEFSFSEET